jgi:hypothetical protein
VLTLTFILSVLTGTQKPLGKYFVKPPLSPYIQECNSAYIIPVSQLDCDKCWDENIHNEKLWLKNNRDLIITLTPFSPLHNTVKPLFIVFIGGLKKKRWFWENNRCGSLYKINKNYQICLYVFTKSKNVHK